MKSLFTYHQDFIEVFNKMSQLKHFVFVKTNRTACDLAGTGRPLTIISIFNETNNGSLGAYSALSSHLEGLFVYYYKYFSVFFNPIEYTINYLSVTSYECFKNNLIKTLL